MNFPDFITQDPDGYIHLAGHRIGLQDVVYFFNEGYSPEMILFQFPTLSLVLIYKTIAFYLENQNEVDAHVRQCQADMERLRATAKQDPLEAEFQKRLAAFRRAEGA